MLILCPNCKTRFDVDPGKVNEEKKFRCSNCRAVFKVVRKAQLEAEPKAAQATGSASTGVSSPSVPPAPPAAAPAPAAPAAPPAAAVSGGSPGGLKVVVANESAAFCEAVRKILEDEPFEVFTCNDGKVALQTVERVRPDVLLLDVALPTMFGFEVCERVRQEPALSGVKIVLIASIYDKTRYKRAPNSLYGADDYIEKHHIPDTLIPMIYGLTSGNIPFIQAPDAAALAAQQESRSELREAEEQETAIPEQAATAAAAPAPVPDPPGAAQAAPPAEAARPASPPAEEVGEPAVAAKPQSAGDVPPAHLKARRLARIIVSDIVLYNQGKVEQGVRDGSLYELLADDIREGERLYRQRIPEEVRQETSFLKDAFEELIAKKRAELRI